MNNIELTNKIKEIVDQKYSTKRIQEIEDRGNWYKHIYKVIFNDNSQVYVKLKIEDGTNIMMEKNICDLLNENDINQPKVSFVDLSKKTIPYEYGIYEDTEGIALSTYLNNYNSTNNTIDCSDVNSDMLKKIYCSIGEYFKRYAEIGNSFAGIWDTVYDKPKYSIHPVDAMYYLEIENGSGNDLFSKGILSQAEYDKIKEIYQRFILKVKNLPIHLTHFSSFPWCLYLSHKDDKFAVSKVTAVGDILWWNEYATVAHVLYPPFYEINDELRESFMKGYNRNLDNEILMFFKLFYRICALNGTYLQPAYVDKDKFEVLAKKDIKELIKILH